MAATPRTRIVALSATLLVLLAGLIVLPTAITDLSHDVRPAAAAYLQHGATATGELRALATNVLDVHPIDEGILFGLLLLATSLGLIWRTRPGSRQLGIRLVGAPPGRAPPTSR